MTLFKPSRPPVIIFSGEFWTGSSGLGLAQGFRRLGWAVQEIDLSRIFGGMGNSLVARGCRRILATSLAREFERDVQAAVRALMPDVFFSIKGTRITRELLAWVGDQGVKRALFYPDVHFDHPSVNLEDFDLYDAVFTSKSFHMEYLKGKIGIDKVFYVPHGYSDDVHWPILGKVNEDSYEADIQHIGAHSAYKQTWMEAVHIALPEAKLRIMGARWELATGNSALITAELGDSVYNVHYSRTLATARVNIALMMGPNATGWQDYVSTRTFEIAACRGFMIHIDNDELREFFTPGEELDVFRTPEELIDKVQYYLKRPNLREKMAASAYERAVPAYGYCARAEAISQILLRRDM